MASQNSHPLLSYQPLKLIFQLAYIGTVVVRLPFWIATAVVPSFRPRPEWTTKQAFMSRVAYAMFDMKSRIGITETLSLEAREEGTRFQVIEPSSSNLYKGPLDLNVKPEVVGATWYPNAPGAEITSKSIVLYFHGGAFIQGDGRTQECGFMANNWIDIGGMDAVLSIQYRLSGYLGVNPFPAAVQDALTCYLYLLNGLKIPAGQIILSGDSAGGNMAIALIRYIEEFGTELRVPKPKCMVLLSPWVAPFDYNVANNRNRGTDYIPVSPLKWGAHVYAGRTPASNPYITPLGQPFATSVPVFVNIGAAEVLCDSIKRWADEMKNVEGNKLEVYLETAAVHDTFLLGGVMGFEESAREVTKKIKAFILRY